MSDPDDIDHALRTLKKAKKDAKASEDATVRFKTILKAIHRRREASERLRDLRQ